MSRKGKLPIPLPKGSEAKITKDEISIKGPKGSLTQKLIPAVQVTQNDNQLEVQLTKGYEEQKQFHGLFRTLIDNMVKGTSQGFEKRLEMVGVGYRAAVKGGNLELQIGVSHPTAIPIPENIEVKVENNTLIIITGPDKQKNGQFASIIRAKRKPEPYQGKGIRYKNEYVRKKAGKTAGKK